MQHPRQIYKEVSIFDLIPGEEYYAISTQNRGSMLASSQFKGIFTEYWTNSVGYQMLRFNTARYIDTTGYEMSFGSDSNPHFLYWRVWPDGDRQSYRYYKVARFTKSEIKELKERIILRKRRQYERGLTGSTPTGLWFPRDLVREISLKYLTDPKVGCAGRWR